MARDSLRKHLAIEFWYGTNRTEEIRLSVNGEKGYINFDYTYELEPLVELDTETIIGPKVIVEWSK